MVQLVGAWWGQPGNSGSAAWDGLPHSSRGASVCLRPCHALAPSGPLDGALPLDWVPAAMNEAAERVSRALQRLPAAQHTEEMRRLQLCEQELSTAAALERQAAAGRLSPDDAFKASFPTAAQPVCSRAATLAVHA